MMAVESTCRFQKGWSLGQTKGEVEGAELNTLGDSSGLRGCLTIWGLVHGPGRGLAEVKGRRGVECRGGRER